MRSFKYLLLSLLLLSAALLVHVGSVNAQVRQLGRLLDELLTVTKAERITLSRTVTRTFPESGVPLAILKRGTKSPLTKEQSVLEVVKEANLAVRRGEEAVRQTRPDITEGQVGKSFASAIGEVNANEAKRLVAFYKFYKRADKVLPRNTNLLSEMKVFISMEGDTLHVASNYVRRDQTSTSPIDEVLELSENHKIQSLIIEQNAAPLNVRDLIAYLAKEKKSGNPVIGDLDKGFQSQKPTIYIEQNVLKHRKFNNLHFDDIADVRVIGEGDGVRRQIKTFYMLGNKKKVVIELQPESHVYVNVNLERLDEVVQDFQLPFYSKDARLLPLLEDTTTLNLVKETLPSGVRLEPQLSVKGLRETFAANRNQTIFPLGHMENGQFVVLNSLNKEVFRISIQKLERIAEDYGITIIPLGCKSITSTGRIGVLQEFNTVDVVHKFHNAVKERNWMGFYKQLAGPEFSFVLDRSVLDAPQRRYRLLMIQREQRKENLYEAGRVAVASRRAGRGADFGGSENTDSSRVVMTVEHRVHINSVENSKMPTEEVRPPLPPLPTKDSSADWLTVAVVLFFVVGGALTVIVMGLWEARFTRS